MLFHVRNKIHKIWIVRVFRHWKKKTIKQKRIFNSAYLERYLDLPISVASPRPKRFTRYLINDNKKKKKKEWFNTHVPLTLICAPIKSQFIFVGDSCERKRGTMQERSGLLNSDVWATFNSRCQERSFLGGDKRSFHRVAHTHTRGRSFSFFHFSRTWLRVSSNQFLSYRINRD